MNNDNKQTVPGFTVIEETSKVIDFGRIAAEWMAGSKLNSVSLRTEKHTSWLNSFIGKEEEE